MRYGRVVIEGYPKYTNPREARIGKGRTATLTTKRKVFDAHGHVTQTGTANR